VWMSCSIGVTSMGLPNEAAEHSVDVPDKPLTNQAAEQALSAKSAEGNVLGGDVFDDHIAQHRIRVLSGKSTSKIRSEGAKVEMADPPASDDEDVMQQTRRVPPMACKPSDGQLPVSIGSLEAATARQNELHRCMLASWKAIAQKKPIVPPLKALGTALVSALGKRGHHRSCAWPIEGKAASPPEQQDRERCFEWKINLPKPCTGATEAGGAFAIDVFPRAGVLCWRVMRTHSEFKALSCDLQRVDQIAYREISSQFPCWLSSHEGRRSKLEAWLRSVIADCPRAPLWNSEVIRFLTHMRI